jgi:hypothetical protein
MAASTPQIRSVSMRWSSLDAGDFARRLISKRRTRRRGILDRINKIEQNFRREIIGKRFFAFSSVPLCLWFLPVPHGFRVSFE